MYLGGVDAKTPLASPIYADLKGLPPLLVQVGMDEILYSDSITLVEKARQIGVDATIQPWEQGQHVSQFASSFIPEGQHAIDCIGEFICKHA